MSMIFGWRPIQSCYGNTTPLSSQMNGTAGASGCAQPLWFWAGLVAAILLGTSHGKEKKEKK